VLESRDTKILLKKTKPSDSKPFLKFLTQLRQRTPNKQVAIIPDNASLYRSKKTKEFLKHHKNIHLFYLPPYSPKYNPVEMPYHCDGFFYAAILNHERLLQKGRVK